MACTCCFPAFLYHRNDQGKSRRMLFIFNQKYYIIFYKKATQTIAGKKTLLSKTIFFAFNTGNSGKETIFLPKKQCQRLFTVYQKIVSVSISNMVLLQLNSRNSHIRLQLRLMIPIGDRLELILSKFAQNRFRLQKESLGLESTC